MRLALLTVLAGLVVVAAPALQAQEAPGPGSTIDIELDFESGVHGDEGTELLLVTEPVPADLVGATCDAVADGSNNESVHPNSDLIIRSANEVVIPDVEAIPNSVTPAPEGSRLILGETVPVAVRFGADGVFSGGFVVRLTCSTTPEVGGIVVTRPEDAGTPAAAVAVPTGIRLTG